MPGSSNVSLLGYTAAAAAAIAVSIRVGLALTKAAEPDSRRILPSPRTTLLPLLTAEQQKSLSYPPEALPGARDVSTPYGSMRVYEWGPEDGRRVLMVHGNATPSPLFGPMAHKLVASGCRVMTFDTWGRGYSDTPVGFQHDSRLFMHQIMYAITSSSIAWTGTTRFSLVGFSLGGAISLDFFTCMPSLVESLILLAPVGLLRDLPPEYKSFFFRYPGLASATRTRRLIGAALGVDVSKVPKTAQTASSERSEGFTPAGSCQFQFDFNAGHIESFLSTLQYGPAQNQEKVWDKAGQIVSGKVPVETPLCGGKILVVCGAEDDVVPVVDIKKDLTTYMGVEGEHWELDTVPGNHGFPWTEGERIAKRVVEFWNLS